MTDAPVIGIVGGDVPRQLVLAAGAIPRRLLGSWSGPVSDRAASLLGAVDPVAARILTELLAPAATLPAALVVCNDSSAHLRLFYVLRLLRDEGLPPVHLLDLPRRDSAEARRFAAVQLRALAEFCAEVTGRLPTAAALGTAADAEREVGAAVAALRDRRRTTPPAVTGTTALAALIAAQTLPPADAVARLEAAVEAVDPAAVRVHVTGSGHPDPSVYAAIEQAGSVIVSDDVDTGDLAWFGETAGGDLAAACTHLADRHFTRAVAAPVSLTAERAAGARLRAAAGGAEVAVSIRRVGDDGPAWDLPAARKELADVGIPVVGCAIADAGGLAEVRATIQALRAGTAES